jgi:hypothetical protein
MKEKEVVIEEEVEEIINIEEVIIIDNNITSREKKIRKRNLRKIMVKEMNKH